MASYTLLDQAEEGTDALVRAPPEEKYCLISD